MLLKSAVRFSIRRQILDMMTSSVSVGTNDIMASQKSGDWQNARINIILKKT